MGSDEAWFRAPAGTQHCQAEARPTTDISCRGATLGGHSQPLTARSPENTSIFILALSSFSYVGSMLLNTSDLHQHEVPPGSRTALPRWEVSRSASSWRDPCAVAVAVQYFCIQAELCREKRNRASATSCFSRE